MRMDVCALGSSYLGGLVGMPLPSAFPPLGAGRVLEPWPLTDAACCPWVFVSSAGQGLATASRRALRLWRFVGISMPGRLMGPSPLPVLSVGGHVRHTRLKLPEPEAVPKHSLFWMHSPLNKYCAFLQMWQATGR